MMGVYDNTVKGVNAQASMQPFDLTQLELDVWRIAHQCQGFDRYCIPKYFPHSVLTVIIVYSPRLPPKGQYEHGIGLHMTSTLLLVPSNNDVE